MPRGQHQKAYWAGIRRIMKSNGVKAKEAQRIYSGESETVTPVDELDRVLNAISHGRSLLGTCGNLDSAIRVLKALH